VPVGESDEFSGWYRLDAGAFYDSVKRSVRRRRWAEAVIGALVVVFGSRTYSHG